MNLNTKLNLLLFGACLAATFVQTGCGADTEHLMVTIDNPDFNVCSN